MSFCFTALYFWLPMPDSFLDLKLGITRVGDIEELSQRCYSVRLSPLQRPSPLVCAVKRGCRQGWRHPMLPHSSPLG